MKRIVDNHLLLSIMTVFAGYMVTNYVLPNAFFARFMSITLMVSGAAALWRFGPTAYEIVVKKLRSEKDDGSYFLVLGIALLALGSIYQGGYGFIWDYLGRPESWVGTWFSRVGQLSMISGFFLLFRSPDITTGPIRIKNAILLAVLILLSLVGAFLAGRGSAAIDDDLSMYFRVHGYQRPSCSPDKPFWVSSSGRIHDRFSPYRNQIIPKACFPTQQAAIDAGYRPLGWAKSDATFQMLKRSTVQPQSTPEAKE